MRHSLFRKYFAICTMCVLTSIIVLGGILMAFAARFFERDRYALLERSVTQAAEITARTYRPPGGPIPGGFDKMTVEMIYSSLSTSIDGGFWLTDATGRLLYYAESGEELYYTADDLQSFRISPAATETALTSGIYEETGTLGDLYMHAQYVVGVPVLVDGESKAVLFVASPADAMPSFVGRLMEMFLFSAIVVLIVAFILIYFITSRMVRPLGRMLAATHSFSKGDFTVRVPVEGYDELGQLSMAFNNMASSLATTESSRRSFVANVSHELKTPMTTIAGFVDGILDGTVPPEKQNQYLQIVSNEVKRLSRLVRSMLDTSRIEAGEMQMNPVWFDISELSRQTIFTFEQIIEEKKLSIEGLDVDKVMVWADKDLMNQVIYNLLENAVKFVNEGGAISFAYHEDNRMSYIAIRNTGEGLDSDEIPRLFDRFYKSDRSRSLNRNGVGLGLHIVRSIINYHQGEVVVRSTPGEFTEFEIGLPRLKKPPREDARQPAM